MHINTHPLSTREYAYGGHPRPGITGVYYTPPLVPPPGGTFRCTINLGTTTLSKLEIERVVKDVSEQFMGQQYNLLERNCNHFTAVLGERLTGRRTPSWFNRAAGVGRGVPCLVPMEWISVPGAEVGEEEVWGEAEDEAEEGTSMLDGERRRDDERRRRQGEEIVEDEDGDNGSGRWWETGSERRLGGGRVVEAVGTPPPRVVRFRDAGGRSVPASERAPVPKRV